MTSSRAFSSPNRYSSGPSTIVIVRSPRSPASPSSTTARRTFSTSTENDRFSAMYAEVASTANAAIASPSTTRNGSRRISVRSLNVAGSPSAPLADGVVRAARRAARTDDHLAPVGNPAPPRPTQPAGDDLVDRPGRPERSCRAQPFATAVRDVVVDRHDRLRGKQHADGTHDPSLPRLRRIR